tara:strand:- start:554 stop:1318 length:765 start_codon:yes stop_codon:yes gene_type:complete
VDKDQIARQFAQALQKAQAQMVEDILDLQRTLTRDEFISLISTLDVDDYIFNQIGMQNELNQYIASYEGVLLGMEATGQVTEETLQALVRLDEATFRKQISTMGEQIIDEAVKGIIGGKTEREIAQSMLGNVLRPDQAETLANTALNTFERNVTAQMTAFDPEDATYVYQGPIDKKTRDICLKMMASGSMTRDDIDSQYPGAFVDGGGFNCRHRWARETSVSRELTDPQQAERFIEKKGGFKREPLTPQQQLDG